MTKTNGHDHEAAAEAQARTANKATGKPFLSAEEFDTAQLHAKELENKVWDVINGEHPNIHTVAMLGGSLAGRIQSVICATQDHVKPELLALHANVYWQAYTTASSLIPKLLLEAQLAVLMNEIHNNPDSAN